jgi:hypothetical protein
MRTFIAAAIAAIASAKTLNDVDFAFVNFIAKHGKNYSSLEEYNLRFERFRAMEAEIIRHNATQKSSVHGHNFLSDFTAEEYSRMLGLKNVAL